MAARRRQFLGPATHQRPGADRSSGRPRAFSDRLASTFPSGVNDVVRFTGPYLPITRGSEGTFLDGQSCKSPAHWCNATQAGACKCSVPTPTRYNCGSTLQCWYYWLASVQNMLVHVSDHFWVSFKAFLANSMHLVLYFETICQLCSTAGALRGLLSQLCAPTFIPSGALRGYLGQLYAPLLVLLWCFSRLLQPTPCTPACISRPLGQLCLTSGHFEASLANSLPWYMPFETFWPTLQPLHTFRGLTGQLCDDLSHFRG